MDIIMIDTQNVIDSLQKIYKKRGLTQQKAYDIVHDYDPLNCPSETTIARVFRKGAKAENFRWETTLRPIANAILKLEEIDSSDDPEEQAYKSIMKLKKDQLGKANDEREEEKTKYHQQLAEETEKFQQSLDFAMHQIKLKDDRIDLLMRQNERLSIMNNRMLEQFMNCPLKNNGCSDET